MTAYTRDGVRRSLLSVVVYPVAALLALWQPIIAVIAFVLVPLFFIVSLMFPRWQYNQRESPTTEPAGDPSHAADPAADGN